MKLLDIMRRANFLKGRAAGSLLPEDPTFDDIKDEAFRICQSAKEIQNSEDRWSDEDWREISGCIERIEAMVSKQTGTI